MPVLNMEVPINTEAYYRGETIARKEGVSLYDKFAQWLNETSRTPTMRRH